MGEDESMLAVTHRVNQYSTLLEEFPLKEEAVLLPAVLSSHFLSESMDLRR
jgi:hypothetical protein